MIRIGEETGELPYMLAQLENIYSENINKSLKEIKERIILFLLISAFLLGIVLVETL